MMFGTELASVVTLREAGFDLLRAHHTIRTAVAARGGPHPLTIAQTQEWAKREPTKQNIGPEPYYMATMPLIDASGNRVLFTPAGIGIVVRGDFTSAAMQTLVTKPSPTAAEVASFEYTSTTTNVAEVYEIRSLASFSVGTGILLGDLLALGGFRTSPVADNCREVGRAAFEARQRAYWRMRHFVGSAKKQLNLMAGCYCVVGRASEGKSTLAALMQAEMQMVVDEKVQKDWHIPLVEWGEPVAGSINGFDVSSALLELSINFTTCRAAILDSARFISLFSPGPAGSKGLSKGALAFLTAMSVACANLGLLLIVLVHPFEVGDDAKAYAAFLDELKASCSGTIVLDAQGYAGGLKSKVSLRRPLAWGDRRPFDVTFIDQTAAADGLAVRTNASLAGTVFTAPPTIGEE